MQILIIAQTIFYLTVSLAIIVLGVLAAMVTYYLIKIAKNVNKISENLDQASDEIKANVKEIIDRLSRLPILSFLLNKENNRTNLSKKGRK